MAPQELRMGGREETAEYITPKVRLSLPDAQEFNFGLQYGVVQYFPATLQVYQATKTPPLIYSKAVLLVQKCRVPFPICMEKYKGHNYQRSS